MGRGQIGWGIEGGVGKRGGKSRGEVDPAPGLEVSGPIVLPVEPKQVLAAGAFPTVADLFEGPGSLTGGQVGGPDVDVGSAEHRAPGVRCPDSLDGILKPRDDRAVLHEVRAGDHHPPAFRFPDGQHAPESAGTVENICARRLSPDGDRRDEHEPLHGETGGAGGEPRTVIAGGGGPRRFEETQRE